MSSRLARWCMGDFEEVLWTFERFRISFDTLKSCCIEFRWNQMKPIDFHLLIVVLEIDERMSEGDRFIRFWLFINTQISSSTLAWSESLPITKKAQTNNTRREVYYLSLLSVCGRFPHMLMRRLKPGTKIMARSFLKLIQSAFCSTKNSECYAAPPKCRSEPINRIRDWLTSPSNSSP